MSDFVTQLKASSDRLSEKMKELRAFNEEADEQAKMDLAIAWQELLTTTELMLRRAVDDKVVKESDVADLKAKLADLRSTKRALKANLEDLEKTARTAIKVLSWPMPVPAPDWFKESMETVHRAAAQMRYHASRV